MRIRTALLSIGALAAMGAAFVVTPTAMASEAPSQGTTAGVAAARPWHTGRRANEAQCNQLRDLLKSKGFEMAEEGCHYDPTPVPDCVGSILCTWHWVFLYRGTVDDPR